MFHVRVSQSVNLRFGVFTVLLSHTVVLLGLIHPCRGQNRVIGPSEPIVALVGEDIVLPSSLDPPVNAFGMTVEWTRPDLDPRFVLVWRDGGELENKKHPSYVGRTSVFSEELKHGIVSLKLSKVKISDGGTYRCFIPDFIIHYNVQLVVGSVSSPVVQMSKNSSTVVLHCESEGWYPEPEVSWLDGEGHVLSAGPTETVRGPDGLHTVSSRVTVEERHRNNFTCRVQQKDINQTRETQIHVPDEFFMDSSDSSSTSSSSAPTIIGVLVVIMFILAAVFVVWKWRQNKIRNKNHPEDEETQTLRETKRNNNSEQELLMGRETDKQDLTAESQAVNNMDKLEEETGLQTEIHQETNQRESENVQCSVNDGTELQFSLDGGRQTDVQPLEDRGTRSGLDKGQEQTETKPISEKRDAPNPAESDLNNKEDETQSVSENTEQLKTEKHSEQPTAEKETVNNMDESKKETGLQTQIHEETQQRGSDNVQCALNEGRRQREQVQEDGGTESGLGEGQVETETKLINETREIQTNPADSDVNKKEDEIQSVSENTEQPMEERQTENNLQTEEEDEEKKSSHDKTEVQCLKEEEKHGETLRHKERDTLMKKLKTKERALEKFEETISRHEGQMKENEEQMKELKQQLEEVERQREETERTIQSVNRQEDKDTKNDLEKKKEELKKKLEKNEKYRERIKKELINTTNKKIKATNEKDEIIKRLKRSEDQSDPVESLSDGSSDMEL